MHAFQYASPESIEDALGLLAGHAGNARILAGGTDLIVQMRSGSLEPGMVIDAKRVPELCDLAVTDDGLVIGSAVTCKTIYVNDTIARCYPALAEAASVVGGVQIQGRASIGGNLCNASPSADTVPALMVLAATARIRGADGLRTVAVEDFCTGPGQNVLGESELLESIHLPAPEANSGSAFLRFTPRNEMDIAVANAAASVILSGDGRQFAAARIAFGATAPTPVLASDAAEYLEGRPVAEESLSDAAKLAREAASPIDDMRGSADQRRHLVQVLVTRALRRAVEVAGGSLE